MVTLQETLLTFMGPCNMCKIFLQIERVNIKDEIVEYVGDHTYVVGYFVN